MNKTLPLYAVGWFLFCAVSFPSCSAEQSSKVDVTEGNDIGFATVADALAMLKSQGLAAVPGSNGDILIIDPNNKAMWRFTTKDDPAHPSAARYVFTKTSGALQAEFTILCEASADQCEKFRSDIRRNVFQLFKMMEGDSPMKCSLNDRTIKCEPVRATGSLD